MNETELRGALEHSAQKRNKRVIARVNVQQRPLAVAIQHKDGVVARAAQSLPSGRAEKIERDGNAEIDAPETRRNMSMYIKVKKPNR